MPFTNRIFGEIKKAFQSVMLIVILFKKAGKVVRWKRLQKEISDIWKNRRSGNWVRR